MKLFLTKGWHGDPILISEKCCSNDLNQLLRSIDWSTFHSVRIEMDDTNWLDVSGNLGVDGLAVVAEEKGVVMVSNNAPKKITDIFHILEKYLKQSPKVKGIWDFAENSRDQEFGSKSEWKSTLKEKRKRERKRYIISLLIVFLIIGFLSSFLYLVYTEELQFIGHNTAKVKAKVINTEVIPAYRGLRQSVQYSFTFEGYTYSAYFVDMISRIYYQKGDVLIVKIAIDDPRISKKLGKLKMKKDYKHLVRPK